MKEPLAVLLTVLFILMLVWVATLEKRIIVLEFDAKYKVSPR